ncbi:MAG: hypothetical protein K2M42_05985 [Oscillospiraceae bacterium]|nr:hypothetical protein [Oscillospiraceae bacterium]
MYKITKDGACLGLTERPTYIRKASNGCLVLCPESEATGIVWEGTPLHLLGRDELEDTETVMLEEVDSGPAVYITAEALSDIDAMNVEHEYRLTLVSLGLTSTDENK